jgi:hypothetical protein
MKNLTLAMLVAAGCLLLLLVANSCASNNKGSIDIALGSGATKRGQGDLIIKQSEAGQIDAKTGTILQKNSDQEKLDNLTREQRAAEQRLRQRWLTILLIGAIICALICGTLWAVGYGVVMPVRKAAQPIGFRSGRLFGVIFPMTGATLLQKDDFPGQTVYLDRHGGAQLLEGNPGPMVAHQQAQIPGPLRAAYGLRSLLTTVQGREEVPVRNQAEPLGESGNKAPAKPHGREGNTLRRKTGGEK